MIEFYQAQTSSIHQTDARAKTIFTLAFILCVNLTPHGSWPALILFFSLILSIFLWSRVSISKVLIRSLISLPFLLAALPLLFTGDEPRLALLSTQQFHLWISLPGLTIFFSIAFKSWLSVLAAIFLVSTTQFDDIFHALRSLGVPKVIVAIFTLMWRYLSLLIGQANSLMQARNSRSALPKNRSGSGGSIAWRAQVTGKMAGNLLLRSLERSERIYAAMTARGYNGEPPQQANQKFHNQDLLRLLAGSLICGLILMFALIL